MEIVSIDSTLECKMLGGCELDWLAVEFWQLLSKDYGDHLTLTNFCFHICKTNIIIKKKTLKAKQKY